MHPEPGSSPSAPSLHPPYPLPAPSCVPPTPPPCPSLCPPPSPCPPRPLTVSLLPLPCPLPVFSLPLPVSPSPSLPLVPSPLWLLAHVPQAPDSHSGNSEHRRPLRCPSCIRVSPLHVYPMRDTRAHRDHCGVGAQKGQCPRPGHTCRPSVYVRNNFQAAHMHPPPIG